MLNKTILQGRLTKDPELRTTQSGISTASFTLAVERSFKGQNGEKQTDFINTVAWRNTADFVAKYFHKGDMAIISGSLQTRTWDDAEGKRHYATEVIADEVHFCGGKKEGTQEQGSSSDNAPAGFTPVEDTSDLPY